MQTLRRKIALKRALLAGAALTLLALTACHGAKHEPTLDPAGTYQLAGDSVTYQAIAPVQHGGGGGDRHGANTDGLVGIGWEAEHAQPRLSENVSTDGHSPRIFTMAFGQNYADRYSSQDSAELTTMAFSVHETACVVIVLPSRRSDNPTASYHVQRVRNDLAAIHQARVDAGSPTVRVDWNTLWQAHPEYRAADGVHLSSTDADGDGRWDAAVAFAEEMLWAGHEQCEAMLS